MAGLRRVVNAPAGSKLTILPKEVRQSQDPSAAPIRITTDPAAPEYRLVDPDATHPWRQKELIAEISAALPEEVRINQFDIQAVRHVFAVDSEARFFYKGKFGSAQYSPEFRDWILSEFSADNEFFTNTREEFARRRGIDQRSSSSSPSHQ